MAVTIDSILISDEYTGNQNGGPDPGLDMLVGSVGDKMWAAITFEVHWETVDIPMTFNSSNNTITRNDCGVGGVGSFIEDGFNAGDTISVVGTGYYYGAVSYTILSLTASTITVEGSLLENATYSSISIYGTTPIDAMDFYYNNVGIQDQQSFKSLSDIQNTQKTSASWTGNPTGNNMNPIGSSEAWWEGYNPVVTYVGTGPLNAYSRQYSIIAPFFIKPFALTNQFSSLQSTLNGQPQKPTPWIDTDCLTFLYQIDIRYLSYSNQVGQSTGILETPANTGWFNEFLNGGTPNYKLTSIAYSISGSPASQIDPTQTNSVILHLVKTDDAIGVDFVLNFMKIPANQNEYQNTATNFREDFIHDRAFQATGGASVNGDQYGTSYQVLTNITATHTLLDLTITFDIIMGAASQAAFSNPQDCNYLIWATPQKANTSSLATTNRNAVICDANTALTNTDNPNLLIISTDATTDVHFFNEPDVDTNPQTNINGMQGDYSYFKCDFLVPVGVQIGSINIAFQTVLYNSLNANPFTNILNTLNLESFNNNLASFFDGQTNNINVLIPTNFPIPSSDPRSYKSIQRKPSMDGSGYLGYEILYGFQIGYGYLQTLPNAIQELSAYGSKLWSGYYSESSFNGGTLPSDTGVRTDLLITWNIVENGITTTFNRRCSVTPGDTGMNTSGITESLSTFDVDGNSLSGVVAQDQITQVTFTFTNTGAFPSPPAYYTYGAKIALWYDNGSEQVLDLCDTNYSLLASSLWLDQPEVTVSGDTCTVTAFLNPLVARRYTILCNLTYTA